MANGNAAGTLIFNQLKTFNESVVYFEQTLSPAFLGGIDSCVREFCSHEEWRGRFELAGDDCACWLAPIGWNLDPEDDDDEPDSRAWFDMDYISGDYDYWEALFCGVGSAGGEAGFMFNCEVKEFGGKRAWLKCVRTEGKIVDSIVALGFKNLNDGRFFFPVRLDAGELAKTWDEFGAFDKNDDCFQPIRDALEIIAKSVPHFDALMQGCQGKAKQKP